MRFEKPVPLKQIAQLINAELIGNTTALATGINEIHKVEKGDLVFVDHPKYYDASIHSAASFIIINKKTDFPEGKSLLIVNDPFEAYLQIVNHGEDSVIMPNVYIGHHVTIGKHCIIHPNVTILDYVSIGDNVIIQAGTVIGSDAFYYNKKTNRDVHYKKMDSCGNVIIENAVEIGANCTIDRGVTGDTLVGAGTKIDNMVHIGHDTVIGKNCLFAGQTAIGGASIIEDNVVLWGQVGVSKTLTIGKNAVVMARGAVLSSIQGNKTYFGYPAIDAKEKMKELVWVKRIPELWEKVMGGKK
jgi:UDP-3-O-[3-hydroxymyristoyl] glucosamine N-acyltransferase